MAWASFRLSGYNADLPADAVPPDTWTGVDGALPKDGILERSVGDIDLAITDTYVGPANTPKCRYEFLAQGRSLTADSMVYAGDDVAGPRARIGLYVRGTGHLDITPAGWAATATGARNFWTGGPLSNGVLVNDVTHQPCWVDPAGGATTILTGGAYRFNALRPYRYMAIGVGDVTALGVTNTVRWSASAVPGAAPNTWAPAAGNDAGSFDITMAGQGQLVDGGQLGNDFIIYGQNSAHLMTYVGGATVMVSRRLSANTGAISRNCYADIGPAHVVLTQDDVVLMNQQGIVRSLVDGRLRRELFTNVYNASDGRQRNSQVWYDQRAGRVYIALPSGLSATYPSRAYVYEVASDTWGRRELYKGGVEQYGGAAMLALESATAGFSKSWLCIADRGNGVALTSTFVRYAESDVSNAGTAPTTYMQRDDLDLGDASRFKTITGLRIRGSAATAVTVRVDIGVKNAATETYTYSPIMTCALGTDQRVPVTVTGRWISVRVYSTALASREYRIHGFDLEYSVRGFW